MKVQKRVSIQGEWAKVKEDINEGDLIKILDEGKVISGDYGDRNVFKIETKNGEKIQSFNQTTTNYLIDAFGDETEKWIGKKVKVWIVKSNVGGKIRNVVYLTAPDWVEGSDGYYPPSGGNIPVIDEDEIPVIEEDVDEDGNPF